MDSNQKKRAGLVIGAGLLAICAGSSLYLGKVQMPWRKVSALPMVGIGKLAAPLGASSAGDPRATYLRSQCSLPLAYLSEEQDRDENIRSALEQLRLGLAEDPWWYVHAFNLSSYEWQTGDLSAALVHMRHAAKTLTARRVQIWFNWGLDGGQSR